MIAAKLPQKPVSFLDEPLKISKSKDPYTMYVEYKNPGHVLSQTAEWKVLAEIGYKAKGSKSWKTKYATLEGAPGKPWNDDAQGSLKKALADVNVDLGNVIDANTISDYSRIITQAAIPTNEIRQFLDDPKAWKSDTKQRTKQIQQTKQNQKQQKLNVPKGKPQGQQQGQQQGQPQGQPQGNSPVSNFSQNSAYSPRKTMTWDQVLSDRGMGQYIDMSKTNLNSGDTLSSNEKYYMTGKYSQDPKNPKSIEYLLFEGPNNGLQTKELAITKDGAKNLFGQSKSENINMEESYNSYEEIRNTASKETNDPKKVVKSVGYDMYNLFIPHKVTMGVSLGDDEWAAINKGEVTKNSPHFSKILKDKKTYTDAINALKNFRSKVSNSQIPSQTVENILEQLDMKEIFDDVWNYFEEGGRQKLISKQKKKNTNTKVPATTPAPAPAASASVPTTTPALPSKSPVKVPKNSLTSSLDDEDIIKRFSDLIFKED